MAKRTVEIIDGFSQVQAFKRAAAKGTTASPTGAKPTKKASEAANPSSGGKAPLPAVGVRSGAIGASSRSGIGSNGVDNKSATIPLKKIGVTVAPKKREIICYSCGYSFTAAGKLHVPYCPKCKILLCTDDIVVDGEQTTDIKTIGDVVIKPSAKLTDGITINGRSVTIGGDISQCAAVLASEEICLESGAVFSPSVLEKAKVVIPQSAEIKVASELRCASLVVLGKLEGKISVAGSIEIKAGGHIVGDVSAKALIMELGAGLTGNCRIIRQQ